MQDADIGTRQELGSGALHIAVGDAWLLSLENQDE